MSTKIYNGYKIKNLNLLETQTFVNKVKDLVSQKLKERHYKTIAILATSLIDDLTFLDYELKKAIEHEDEEKKYKTIVQIENALLNIHKKYFKHIANYIEKVYMEKVENQKDVSISTIQNDLNYKYLGSIKTLVLNYIENRAIKTEISINRDDNYDYETDIVFLPLDNENSLLMVFGLELQNIFEELIENEEYKDFVEQYQLEYYGYWNNVDCPKEITQEEWDERRENWDIALKDGNSIPSKKGINVNITNANNIVNAVDATFDKNIDAFQKQIKSKEERCEIYAESFCQNEYLKNNLKEKYSVSDVIDMSKKWKELIEQKDETILKAIDDKAKEYKDIYIEIDNQILNKTVIDLLPTYNMPNMK